MANGERRAKEREVMKINVQQISSSGTTDSSFVDMLMIGLCGNCNKI